MHHGLAFDGTPVESRHAHVQVRLIEERLDVGKHLSLARRIPGARGFVGLTEESGTGMRAQAVALHRYLDRMVIGSGRRIPGADVLRRLESDQIISALLLFDAFEGIAQTVAVHGGEASRIFGKLQQPLLG